MITPIIRESFAEARHAILPIVARHPDLASKVANLEPLDDDRRVNTFPHIEDGGTYHLAGRIKTSFPMFLMVCDTCGNSYSTR